MEKKQALDALSALAHETRLDVFRHLVQAGPDGAPAGEIGESLGVPSPTLSFHLKELKIAGIVRADRRGRSIVYRADYESMNDLLGYLSKNCCCGGQETEPKRSSGRARPAAVAS